MPWMAKTAECDWCEKEIDGLIDTVYESEKGTLCDTCEQARIQEIEMYQEERGDARINREIQRAVDRSIQGNDQETALDNAVEQTAQFCDKCGQELPEGEADDPDDGIK